MQETIRHQALPIAGIDSEQSIKACVKVHLEFITPECQRFWDETVEREKTRIVYDPKDDAYIIPVAFPMDILLAFNGKIIEPQ